MPEFEYTNLKFKGHIEHHQTLEVIHSYKFTLYILHCPSEIELEFSCSRNIFGELSYIIHFKYLENL